MTTEKPDDLSRTATVAGIFHPDSGFPELADLGERLGERRTDLPTAMRRWDDGLGKELPRCGGSRGEIPGVKSRHGRQAEGEVVQTIHARFQTLKTAEVFEKVLHINYPQVQIVRRDQKTSVRFGAEISRSFKCPCVGSLGRQRQRERPCFGSWV